MIGSTSNMVIGLAAGIGFTEFITYLSFGEVALWIITILALYLIFRKRLGKKKPLPEYNPWQSIENKKSFYQSIFVLALMVLLFLVVDNLGVGPEAVGLGCAILALILSNTDPAEIFKRIDWETVFFIAGFMFLMGGIQETGILKTISDQLFLLVGGDPLGTTMTTLWFSGLASALVSNVAVALTFIPIINNFSILNPNLRLPVSSALIFGTNLGGATTPLSGAVPMMAVGTLKREGISMSFSEFTKVGLITSIIQLAFASLYIIMRFGLGG